MIGHIRIALSAAILLSTAVSASAAIERHRVTHAHALSGMHRHALYDMAPGGGCSPVHPPFCSNICTGSGPCAPPDSW
jgi:hypothetical protein